MVETVPDDVMLLARTYAPDFYLSSLLVPRNQRPWLLALAAFLGDVHRIVTTIQEPAMAEIRLQWWRDCIQAAPFGDKTGHPAADALGFAIRACDLPFADFDGLLDARALDLYADPLPTASAFAAYLAKSDGAAFHLAARCLGAADTSGSALIKSAATAYGLTRLIRTCPVFLARGRAPFFGVAADNKEQLEVGIQLARSQARLELTAARAVWRASPQAQRSACLPLAVVAPYLRASERPGFDPARYVTNVEPLTRIWCLWQAHLTGVVRRW